MKVAIKQAARIMAIVILSLFVIALAGVFLTLPGCALVEKRTVRTQECRATATEAMEIELYCGGGVTSKDTSETKGTVNTGTIIGK